jgi:hypothetical protein
MGSYCLCNYMGPITKCSSSGAGLGLLEAQLRGALVKSLGYACHAGADTVAVYGGVLSPWYE